MQYLKDFIATPIDFTLDYLLPFIVVLSVLVFVHEWGHYIIARICGVRVETFSIGFGREIFGRTDKNGTRWKFSLIPLGGYVQMFGDVDATSASHSTEIEDAAGEKRDMTAEERKVSFFAQPVGRRAAIVFAGPAINYIFAVLLLAGLYVYQGEPYRPAVAAGVAEGSPAEIAGIRPDDKIVRVNGKRIETFQELRTIVTVNLDKEMQIDVARYEGDNVWSDETRPLTLKPELRHDTDRFGFQHSSGRIGITSPESASAVREHTVVSAFAAAGKGVWDITVNTLRALGQIITGVRSTDELGGILRIGAYAGDFAQQGMASFITFMALLSVNLGLINLLPIPALDGGQLAMHAMETIKGGPVSEKVQEYALRVGLVFILAIMVLATWNDLVQLRVVEYVVGLVS